MMRMDVKISHFFPVCLSFCKRSEMEVCHFLIVYNIKYAVSSIQCIVYYALSIG